MQYILEDGTKRFAKDSKNEGSFHALGGLENWIGRLLLSLQKAMQQQLVLKRQRTYQLLCARLMQEI